ncbi:TonB-dependent receptor [Henriciella sp.]|uniref:TonB-dependent receptor n=1 Tax=Henriciella sp. TaxID=1968823 RepID=UPI002617EB62|nr:TonB-dependent receptor [Henriciella sp.]
MSGQHALAQEATEPPSEPERAEANKLDTIFVTARRRAEQVSEVPTSLDVFSGDSLEELGVTSLETLQYQTPGLNIAVGGESTRVSLRGVGTNIASGAPSVAVHIDGVYIPNTQFALTELFDLARVEVLKGPQGTLYGRNATGGVINLVTEEPGSEFSADGWLGYGSFDLVTAQAGASIPLGDRGGIRVSGAFADDEGYTENLNPAGGEIDSRGYAGARLRGQYDLSESLSADFTVQYSEDDGTLGYGGSNNPASPVFASVPEAQRRSPGEINVDTAPDSYKEGLLLSGTLTWDVGNMTLKSITGYGEYEFNKREDVDGSGGFIAFATTDFQTEFFSQELQILGEEPGGLSWTAGLYYASESNRGRGIETDADFPDPTPFIFTDVSQSIDSETVAAFGELTVPLTSKLSATVGGRYTSAEQTGNGVFAAPLFLPEPIPTSASTDDEGFAPKLLLEYRPYDGGHLYASVTRGFKSGGVNIGFEGDTFDPEKIWAYEIGSKNRLANGRVELDLAGFYYDYTDLQLRTALFTDNGIDIRVTNATKAKIAGVELSSLFQVTPDLSVDLSGAYIDSELENFISPVTLTELQGQPTPLTPEVSYTLGAQYETQAFGQGTLTARVEANHQSSITFPQFTDLQRERRDAITLVNANLRYDFPGEQYYLALIGRNLTDEQYLTQRFFYEGFADTEYYAAPRTIEARIGFRF